MLKPADSFKYLYIWGAYFLTACAAGLVCLVLLFMNLRHSEGYPDPFVSYDALKPGLSIGVLAAFPCSARAISVIEVKSACSIQPTNDVFANIEVVEYRGTIERITFFGSDLQTIDLVNHWGKPDSIRQHKRHAVMRWNYGVIAQTTAPTYRFTYQSPIEWVTVIRTSTAMDLLSHNVLQASVWSHRHLAWLRL